MMRHKDLDLLAPSALVVAFCLFLVPGSTEALDYHNQSLRIDGETRTVRLPTGYAIDILTTGLDQPRLLTFGPKGDLFAGSASGKVYRLAPPYRHPEVLVETGDYPHSVAFRKNEMLIAMTDGLYRASYQPGQGRIAAEDVILLAPLPSGGGHSSRTVKVGPDNRVHVSLGISGNCSDQYLDPFYPFLDRRGGILVLQEESGEIGWDTYASGLRNPIGFGWHPRTHTLYASNNGPDHWGFELPPEYFSRVEPGSFHGMPWFQYDGTRVRRDECIKSSPPRPIEEVVPPVAVFPARSAPMDVAFLPVDAADTRLAGDAIVALHGSWATRPFGGLSGDPATRRPPKLVVVRFENGQPQQVNDLVTGFQLSDGDRWARPVGVAVGPDGGLYFTSDAGAEALFLLRPS
jgi:glucose/arabinose dehydrogenase